MKNKAEHKIIVINEEGRTEISKGMALSFNEDEMSYEMIDIPPIDIVRAAVGLLDMIELLGYGTLLRAYLRSGQSEEEFE